MGTISVPSEGWIKAFKHRYSATDRGLVRPGLNGNQSLAGYNARQRNYRVTIDHLGERHTFNGTTLAWLLHYDEWPEFVVVTKNGQPRDLSRENLKVKGDSNV